MRNTQRNYRHVTVSYLHSNLFPVHDEKFRRVLRDHLDPLSSALQTLERSLAARLQLLKSRNKDRVLLLKIRDQTHKSTGKLQLLVAALRQVLGNVDMTDFLSKNAVVEIDEKGIEEQLGQAVATVRQVLQSLSESADPEAKALQPSIRARTTLVRTHRDSLQAWVSKTSEYRDKLQALHDRAAREAAKLHQSKKHNTRGAGVEKNTSPPAGTTSFEEIQTSKAKLLTTLFESETTEGNTDALSLATDQALTTLVRHESEAQQLAVEFASLEPLQYASSMATEVFDRMASIVDQRTLALKKCKSSEAAYDMAVKAESDWLDNFAMSCNKLFIRLNVTGLNYLSDTVAAAGHALAGIGNRIYAVQPVRYTSIYAT